MPVVLRNGRRVSGERDQSEYSPEQRARLQAKIQQAQIELVSVLKPNPNSAKKHSPKQIALLAENIAKFGFHQPLVTDEHGMLLIGHARLQAAKELKLTEVPVRCLHIRFHK